MRTISIDLPFPSDACHQNARVNRFILAKAKAKDLDVGEKCAKKALGNVPFKGIAPKWERATVSIHFRFPNRRGRDLLNYAAACKSQIDGIVLAGVVADDKCTVLERVTDISWSVDKGNQGVTIVFTALDEIDELAVARTRRTQLKAVAA